jgi:hypothetical protein
MAVSIGTNAGFVTSTPSTDPAGTNVAIDGLAAVVKDTSPSGSGLVITEVGWWCDTASEAGNYTMGLYSANGAVVPASYGWMTWDIAELAKDAITNNGGILNLLVKYQAETDSVDHESYFYSVNYNTNTTLRPKLVLNWTPSSSTPTIPDYYKIPVNIYKGDATVEGSSSVDPKSWEEGNVNQLWIKDLI